MLTMTAIGKRDVLMEDFSNVVSLIEEVASDREMLLEARNSWEVIFEGYDDDPREIPEIPEVTNWIERSLDEGIPWFYFMRCEGNTLGLLIFMIVCAGVPDKNIRGRYLFDRDRLATFIEKNFENLNRFMDAYGIGDDIGRAVTDDVMGFIAQAVSGAFDSDKEDRQGLENKQKNEAIKRLMALEKLFGLNPKVRKYFEDGKLYYSYLTGGGYIGSIDTINYDKRYADIVDQFEEQTDYLVYHVIEHNHTLSLLFVNDDYTEWEKERPTLDGVMAYVISLSDLSYECGYIKLDVLGGALRRRDGRVYPELAVRGEEEEGASGVTAEAAERLEILRNAGMETDLNVAGIYVESGEMCFSELKNVFTFKVGVVDRVSANPEYARIARSLAKQIEDVPYFLMVCEDGRLAFLFVSKDTENWEKEKRELEQKRPVAIVIDPKTGKAFYKTVGLRMVNGGPVCIMK